MNILRDKSVDIDKYPDIQTHHDVSEDNTRTLEIIFGDLHANAQKLLYFLVREGIFKISKDDYTSLSLICNLKPEELQQHHIRNFCDILSSNVQVEKIGKVILIGDEVADWGNNDYFILKILEKLILSGLHIEILLSNHGAEFVDIYEQVFIPNQHELPDFKGRGAIRVDSMQSVGVLIRRNLVDMQEIQKIVQQCYYPYLKLCSYSLLQDDNAIVFTHAHVGLETIKALASHYSVNYDDSTARKLCDTMDAINARFRPKDCSQITPRMKETDSKWHQVTPSDPLIRVIWHIGFNDIEVPSEHHGYKLTFVNGHAGYGEVPQNLKNVINLDNKLGKGEDKKKSHREGEYSVMYIYK